MRRLLVGLVLVGCGSPPAGSLDTGLGDVLPLCGECFRVVDDFCVDDGTCPSSACSLARPDLAALVWTNDPGLNWHVDFTCSLSVRGRYTRPRLGRHLTTCRD